VAIPMLSQGLVGREDEAEILFGSVFKVRRRHSTAGTDINYVNMNIECHCYSVNHPAARITIDFLPF
jgi:hypothetical protein